MGWNIQMNPAAEANHVSDKLMQVLDGFVQDHAMRYCWVDPDPALIEALQAIEPQGVDEAWVIGRLAGRLATGDCRPAR